MLPLPCPVQAECGGCGLMPLPLPAQHDAKLDSLCRSFEQHGMRLERPTISPSPHALGYRNRIRLGIDSSGAVRFFNQRKQPSCAVLEPTLRERLTEVLELSRQRPQLFARFRHCELRSDDDLGRPGLTLGGPDADVAVLLEPAAELAAELDAFLVGVRSDPEIAYQQRRILDNLLAFVPLDGFWQINSAVNSHLVEALRRGAAQRGLRTLLDLYAGAGNFTIPLAAGRAEVCAVEIHGPAVRALRAAAAAQHLSCEAYAEPALSASERLQREGRSFELVLIDAPRAGARDVIGRAAQLASRSVAVCSCNPSTLARDLSELQSYGFELEELRAFDMFPHTEHLEVLAWLARS